MPNEPHRQARELGTGGVRTSLRRQRLGRKGTQRRRRAWSRVRLNNSRWLQSSPSLESSSHRHRSDDFLVFFLIPKSTLSTEERMTRGVTSASAAPWSTRSLAQPRTVPLLRGTDHFPLRSNSKSGNTSGMRARVLPLFLSPRTPLRRRRIISSDTDTDTSLLNPTRRPQPANLRGFF